MKDSITTKELVTLLSRMKDGNHSNAILKALDPEFSEEYGHFLLVQAHKKADAALEEGKGTFNSAVAELLEEEIMNGEKVSIAHAILLLQWAEFNRGAEHMKNTLESPRENPLPAMEAILSKLKEKGIKARIVDMTSKKE